MINYILLFTGITLIILSLLLLKKEWEYNSDISNGKNDSDEIINSLDSMEDIIQELNLSFYETINEIEKKYNYLEQSLKEINYDLTNSNKYPLTSDNFNTHGVHKFQDNNNVKVPKDVRKNIFQNSIIREKVINLKKKGLTPSQIAKELDMGTGEVLLIINLNK